MKARAIHAALALLAGGCPAPAVDPPVASAPPVHLRAGTQAELAHQAGARAYESVELWGSVADLAPLADLEETGTLSIGGAAVTGTAELPALARVGFLHVGDVDQVTTIDLPALATAGGVTIVGNAGLTALRFPALRDVGALDLGGATVDDGQGRLCDLSAALPSLRRIGDLVSLPRCVPDDQRARLAAIAEESRLAPR